MQFERQARTHALEQRAEGTIQRFERRRPRVVRAAFNDDGALTISAQQHRQDRLQHEHRAAGGADRAGRELELGRTQLVTGQLSVRNLTHSTRGRAVLTHQAGLGTSAANMDDTYGTAQRGREGQARAQHLPAPLALASVQCQKVRIHRFIL